MNRKKSRQAAGNRVPWPDLPANKKVKLNGKQLNYPKTAAAQKWTPKHVPGAHKAPCQKALQLRSVKDLDNFIQNHLLEDQDVLAWLCVVEEELMHKKGNTKTSPETVHQNIIDDEAFYAADFDVEKLKRMTREKIHCRAIYAVARKVVNTQGENRVSDRPLAHAPIVSSTGTAWP